MKEYSNYLNRPIFISGFQKSGTTLLLSLLDGHPQLVVFPEELFYFRRVMFERDKAKAIRENTGFKMFLPNWDTEGWSQADSLLREGYPEFNCAEFNQWVDEALMVHQSEKDLLLLLIKAFAKVDRVDPASKLYWASKTPRDEIFFPLMQQMFGNDFKLLYIVRDPRDVYASISKKNEIEGKQNQQGPERLIQFSVSWQTQINRAIQYRKKHENVLILRYEDLLTETEKTVGELCDFLQIDYSEELLQPTRHGKPWGGNSAFSGGFQGISNAPVNRFKGILDPRDKSLLEHFLSKELVSLNYADSGSFPVVEVERKGFSQTTSKVPWIEYWMTFLQYQRWYFLKQVYTTFRYSFLERYL